MTQANVGSLTGHTLDEFQLVALLGAGGMAEVYRGRDLRLRREVAIKVLPAWLATDPNYVTRFRDEARKVAALNHPNVVPIYSFGENQGQLYHVMPLLRESLRDYINRVGIMPIHESVTLIVQIATALETAHKHGIVHRDVKPENILLDGKRKALLTDFGIARELSFLRQPGTARTLSATGLPIGTPEYMAPEQLRDGPVDQRADIYGLGAVLYELFTGAAPHEAGSPYEVASLVLTTPVANPSQHNPDVSPALEQVVLTALAKEPDERYASMSEFASALQNALLLTNPSMPRYTMPLGRKGTLAGAGLATGKRGSTTYVTMTGTSAVGESPAPAKRGRGKRMMGARALVAVLAAVTVVAALLGGGAILHMLGPDNSGKPLIIATSTAAPTDTATTAPTATAAPTATLSPTATTASSTATPSLPPPNVIITPTKWQITYRSGTNSCNSYRSSPPVPQLITNKSNHPIYWSWQPGFMPSKYSFYWQLNGTSGNWLSGPPFDASLAPGATDTLNIKFSCPDSSQTTYQVTMVARDTVTNIVTTYALTLIAPGPTG